MRTPWIVGLALAFASGPIIAAEMAEYDLDADGRVSQEEFSRATAEADMYGAWDTDADNQLDQTEFDQNAYGWDYAEWDTDADATIDRDEYAEGYFNAYDDDEDGHWDGDEWDDAGEAGLFDW